MDGLYGMKPEETECRGCMQPNPLLSKNYHNVAPLAIFGTVPKFTIKIVITNIYT